VDAAQSLACPIHLTIAFQLAEALSCGPHLLVALEIIKMKSLKSKTLQYE
jgi:hypothetical protein